MSKNIFQIILIFKFYNSLIENFSNKTILIFLYTFNYNMNQIGKYYQTNLIIIFIKNKVNLVVRFNYL